MTERKGINHAAFLYGDGRLRSSWPDAFVFADTVFIQRSSLGHLTVFCQDKGEHQLTLTFSELSGKPDLWALPADSGELAPHSTQRAQEIEDWLDANARDVHGQRVLMGSYPCVSSYCRYVIWQTSGRDHFRLVGHDKSKDHEDGHVQSLTVICHPQQGRNMVVMVLPDELPNEPEAKPDEGTD